MPDIVALVIWLVAGAAGGSAVGELLNGDYDSAFYDDSAVLEDGRIAATAQEESPQHFQKTRSPKSIRRRWKRV